MLFLQDCETRRLSPSTIRWYRSKLLDFTRWLDGEGIVDLGAVDTPTMRRYLATLARATVLHQHNCGRTLRRFYHFLLDESLITVAPAIPQPKLPRIILPALTEAQVRAVLEVCDERDRAIVLTILDSGLRASELCALNVQNVDLSTGTVFVQRGKGDKTRITFIGAQTMRAIREHLTERQPARPSAPMFPNKTTGTRLTVGGVVQLMERLREASGVETLTAHTLRRTFAITALRGGMDIHILARLMGHADIQVLWRYLDILDADLKEAHARVRPVERLIT